MDFAGKSYVSQFIEIVNDGYFAVAWAGVVFRYFART
jgi:hypothetical protein